MSNVPQFYPQRNGDSNSWSNLPQIIWTPGILAPSSTLFLTLILKGGFASSGFFATSLSPLHPFFFQGRSFPKKMPKGFQDLYHLKKAGPFLPFHRKFGVQVVSTTGIKKLSSPPYPESPVLFPLLYNCSVLLFCFHPHPYYSSHYYNDYHHHLHLVPGSLFY